jgi:hypothetical protein
VSATSSVGTNVQTLTLTGNGVNGGLGLSATTLAFGTTPHATVLLGGVVIGGTTVTRTLTVSSTGPAPLIISGVTTSDPTDYAITNGCGTGAHTVGTTCTITVRFLPKSVGSKPATLRIAGNMPATPTVVNMTGIGS